MSSKPWNGTLRKRPAARTGTRSCCCSSIHGVGRILSLVMLYEIHDINRFETVQDFASYCRLVKCPHESAGKKKGTGGAKIGNAHLKWAFSEAAVSFIRHNPPGKTAGGEPGQEARQGESAVHPGPQAGAGDLLHAEKQRAVQPGEIHGNGIELEGTGAARRLTGPTWSEHDYDRQIKQCAIERDAVAMPILRELCAWIGAPSRSLHK